MRRHACALGVVVGAALLAVGAHLLLARLWSLQARELAWRLAVVGVVVLAFIGGGVGWVVSRASVGPIRAIDARWALPRPQQPLWRYLLFVVVPTAALVVPFVRAYADLMGRLVLVLGLSLVLVVAGATELAWRRVRPAAARRRRAVMLGVVGAWLGSLVATVALYGRDAEAARITETSLGGGAGAELLRLLSDVDRDGASSLLGGQDCAPWSGARGPFAAEVPGNGVDEDCDGMDGVESVVAIGPAFSGRWPPEKTKPYNIVWVVIDGVRADHTSTYGYERPTTPALTALASQGWRFERAFSQSSATAFSFASMFTGANPAAMQWERTGGTQQVDPSHVTIAERLQARGYLTALFVNRWMHSTYPRLHQGFERVVTPHVLPNWRHWSQRVSPMLTAQIIELVEGAVRRGAPFFVVAHYNDPHFPYVAHEQGPHFGTDPASRYDGELAFADRHVGFLLSYLRYRQPLWDQTIVIVTSDHGEEFDDHGHRHHARTCHVESTRVPLVVRIPSTQPAVVRQPVALVDLVPTILEAVGAKPEAAERLPLAGQSLLVPRYAPEEVSPERPIFCAIAGQFEQAPFIRRAVRVGPWALLQDVRRARVELYDTSVDPGERHNLAAKGEQQARVELLRGLLAHTNTGNLARP